MRPEPRTEVGVRLLREGYGALPRLRETHQDSDWFRARLLGRQALVVRGSEGARLFYDADVVARHGAVPAPIRLVLFGRGAVHGLDGAEHALRKQQFLNILSTDHTELLRDAVVQRLQEAVPRWCSQPGIRLFDELVELYGAAVLDWAGIDTDADEARRISHDLADIVDGFAPGGTPYARAILARRRMDRWAGEVIGEVRNGTRHAPANSALDSLAATTLPRPVAAVELLNILRPTVAVAWFGAWVAHALDAHPKWKARLAAGTPVELRAFEHEVRRWYPFAPLLTGRLLQDVSRGGIDMPRGGFLILDVVGTNRDPRAFTEPEHFRPERFLGREPGPYEYVPQGGGPYEGHRCPGEPTTTSLLEVTARRLSRLDFDLPTSSRIIDLERIPARPGAGMELRNVRPSGRSRRGAASAGEQSRATSDGGTEA